MPVDKTKTRLNAVVKQARRKDVSTLINACDAGREGELRRFWRGGEPAEMRCRLKSSASAATLGGGDAVCGRPLECGREVVGIGGGPLMAGGA